jgi:hypothetical protein
LAFFGVRRRRERVAQPLPYRYNAGMRQSLKLHPDSHCSAVARVDVDVARRDRALLLSYRVAGAIGDLRLPPMAAAARADELWRHTCFEAFVRPAATGEAYYELNFAPSTQWAAYGFDGYRSGMRVAAEVGAPRIEVERAPERFALQAAFELAALPFGRWRLGLAAVIEDTTGRLSYWALAHPAGKPDFHRADCFTCEI